MLIIIGASLHGSFHRNQVRDLVLFTGMRLIALPLVYIAIIRALPLPADLELLATIVALMPTSAVSPMMAAPRCQARARPLRPITMANHPGIRNFRGVGWWGMLGSQMGGTTDVG